MAQSNLIKCNICRNDLSPSKFAMKLNGSGKCKSCKKCADRQKETQKLALKRKSEEPKFMTRNELMNDQIDFSAPIDLKLLLELDSWSKEEIRELLHKVIFYKRAPYRMKIIDIFKKHFPSRSVIMCGKVYREFMEAAANGEDFEKYLNSDREYRKDGKKILAGKK